MKIMKRLTQVGLAVLIAGLGLALFLKGSSPLVTTATAQTQNNARNLVSDQPPDKTPYWRPALPGEFLLAVPRVAGVFIVDPVVNNTDPNLTNTDTFNDGETSIAVNPANPNEIVITSFAEGWGAFAPLWHSTDGGNIWTKEFTIPNPPGIPMVGCPCDQTVDYGRVNQASGTFLDVVCPVCPLGVLGVDTYSGTTTNPASAAAWNWDVIAGTAQRTNLVPSSFGSTDQPWLLVNRDPTTAAQDNVYVGYDDFSGSPDMRVAVSFGVNPPVFTVDHLSGFSTGFVNPGHRLAVDPSTGTVYSLFQRRIAPGVGGSQNIDYMLNRSTDGGATWILNASATGIVVANADSTQPTPKFGTANALLGGVDHAAVDPNTGDVYYVYGNRDPITGNNRLAIRRIFNGVTVTVGPEHFVTASGPVFGGLQAAIPSVAVTSNGTVGVFYYTFNGFTFSGFPRYSAHLALSTDQGVTFSTLPLLFFVSSAMGDGNPSQRVLGDYMQMKAVGNTFFGSFTGNGLAFGRPFSNHDPIFFKVSVPLPTSH
jgi:hypothetical protein